MITEALLCARTEQTGALDFGAEVWKRMLGGVPKSTEESDCNREEPVPLHWVFLVL